MSLFLLISLLLYILFRLIWHTSISHILKHIRLPLTQFSNVTEKVDWVLHRRFSFSWCRIHAKIPHTTRIIKHSLKILATTMKQNVVLKCLEAQGYVSSFISVTTGIWEKMLLPCLRSPSIFVQREGVNVISAFILKLMDTQVRPLFVKVITQSQHIFVLSYSYFESSKVSKVNESIFICVFL